MVLRADPMPNSRWPIEEELLGILAGFLVSECFIRNCFHVVLFIFFIFIFTYMSFADIYGFRFLTFMEFLCLGMCVSLHLYMFLVLFVWLLFFCMFSSTLIFFLNFVLVYFIIIL